MRSCTNRSRLDLRQSPGGLGCAWMAIAAALTVSAGCAQPDRRPAEPVATVWEAPPAVEAAPTGVLFPDQTADSLAEAVRFFEDRLADFDDPAPLRLQAERFSLDRFRSAIERVLREEGAL